jgi:hypothetical protein
VRATLAQLDGHRQPTSSLTTAPTNSPTQTAPTSACAALVLRPLRRCWRALHPAKARLGADRFAAQGARDEVARRSRDAVRRGDRER